MRYYDEIYSETIPFKFVKYIVLAEAGLGIVFLILYAMQLGGSLGIEDELPSFFFLIMAVFMFAVAVFLYSLIKLKLSISAETLRASFGFIKFEVPLSKVEKVSTDEGSSIKYGGWGVRLAKARDGWMLAYTSIGFRRVILELKEHKYKYFIFSTAYPDEVINIINQQLKRGKL